MSAASEAGTFGDRDDALAEFGRTLRGKGLEIGPANQPFDRLPEGCQVTYVDRWPTLVSRLIFRELGWRASWVRADVRVDIDREGLRRFGDCSQDFVIAGHVVEHVANPVLLIAESYRVLAEGGLLLILVPNRHRTFDNGRQPTPLHHVLEEYRDRVPEVDDAHVRAFLAHTGELKPGRGQARQIRRHRRRSVHAHCWDEPEFFEILEYLVRRESQAWSLEDFFPTHMYSGCHEFGYLLRRVGVDDPDRLADRLAESRLRLIAVSDNQITS